MFICSDTKVKFSTRRILPYASCLSEQPVYKSTFVSFKWVSVSGFCHGLEHVIYRGLQRAYLADMFV
jgi:hypothetical protein